MQELRVSSQPMQKPKSEEMHGEILGELGVISMRVLHVGYY